MAKLRRWQRKKKVSWTERLAGFFSPSRAIALFAGLVALLGGARELRRRTSQA
jgi:hypothetical protein